MNPIRRISRYVFIIIVVSSCPVNYAGASPSVWLGPSIQHFEFCEFDIDGRRLNKEEGFLPGLTGGFSQTSRSYSYQTILAYHSNDIHHDGQTQAGLPVKTRTDESIFDGKVQIEKYLHSKDNFQIAILGGVGYRYWGRDIRGTRSVSGLAETYDWIYVEAGLSANYEHNFNSEWGIDLNLIWPVDPEIEVDFPNNYDDIKLDLGSDAAIRARLSWTYNLNKSIEIGVESYIEYWKLDRSDSSPLLAGGTLVGSVVEPRSETRAIGVAVTVSRNF